MALKVVLLNFSGVILKDVALQRDCLNEVLQQEGFEIPSREAYHQFCLGRGDRDGLRSLFSHQRQSVTQAALNTIAVRKQQLYTERLQAMAKLPIYPGLADLIYTLRVAQIQLGVVGEADRPIMGWVLEQAKILNYVSVLVSQTQLSVAKPNSAIYRYALGQLNQAHPQTLVEPADCLAIENTFVGIEAAQRAGIWVVGVANTYPFRMLHRRTNWVVDYLSDLDLEQIKQAFANSQSVTVPDPTS